MLISSSGTLFCSAVIEQHNNRRQNLKLHKTHKAFPINPQIPHIQKTKSSPVIQSINPTPKMALRFHLLSAKLLPQPTNFHTHPFPSSSSAAATYFIKFNSTPRKSLKISCTNEEISSDDMLAVELDLEISKLNTNMLQTEEALKKSRELLFTELCNFMGLNSVDLKKKWERMNEEEKWVLAKGFVTEWSAHFHPLSAKSVKEMVNEHLVEEKPLKVAASTKFFPNFGKLMGFSPN
ncbi:Hypothetical predicted protein [Olea europaea subsp. europaea]|uniref:DUF7026 domain-containing protein n=1 Tax=Olea europaea subsp. europaea TaxID=158383 RepID=A0A8S0QG85_OLEEU|nr:Hypothetical predicted protein [Olea europaea subsp. europaea]